MTHCNTYMIRFGYCSITPFHILDNQGFNHPTISHLPAPSLVSTLGQCMRPEHQWLTPLPVWTLPVCDDQSYRCRHGSFSSPGHLNPTLSFTILDYLITLDVKLGSSSTPFQEPTICGSKVPQIHSHPSMKPTLKQENRSTSAGAGLPETPPFTEEALKFGSFICSFSDHRPKYYVYIYIYVYSIFFILGDQGKYDLVNLCWSMASHQPNNEVWLYRF